ncbi:TolC family protein [Pedobacter sp. SYSU D00535]|uniref:TolC family protein n=1 Tax=Pedobacter sp. SYSU D00535 TaxID=2810308 RepID=UPI001A96ABA6|nr:TolC family protein [Pedobacter sp. SYSU D00535]
MRINFKIFFSLALVFFTSVASAQQLLTLEEAVRIALENNYNIRIARNDVDIAENNVSRANAGFIPSVNANLTNNNTIQNSSQTRATGEVTERNNARGSSLNYGVGLNWTVFDGFRMFARYDQLQELQKLGEANLQLTILTTLGDVISNYYNLVQQQQQLRAYDTAVAISRLRVETAQTRFEIGRAARLEVLNAQVDYNTDTTSYLRQLESYRNAQITLNQLLAREATIVFSVAEDFNIDTKLLLPQLMSQALTNNPTLRAALVSRRIAELDLRLVRANRYPVIGLNTGYNFNRSESALGFATLNTGRGFNYGLTASVNIFNGFLQRRNERNASIAIESAGLDYERVNQSLNAQLATAYQTYQTNLSLVQLEENNVRIARQNLDITMARYRLGSITQVEIRDAQLNFVNATVRLNSARYQAKLAEVALREISGNLSL